MMMITKICKSDVTPLRKIFVVNCNYLVEFGKHNHLHRHKLSKFMIAT